MVDDGASRHEYRFGKRQDRATGGDITFTSNEPQLVLECYRERDRGCP